MNWEINDHAFIYIEGKLQPDINPDQYAYNNMIRLMRNNKILFYEYIKKVEMKYGGVTDAIIKGVSASEQLDRYLVGV